MIVRLHELAEAVGRTKEEVAAEIGVPQEGRYWMNAVDDEKAAEYLAGQEVAGGKTPPVAPEQPSSGLARFWSPVRHNELVRDGDDIKFSEWVFVCKADGEEAKYLRQPHIRDIAAVYEVVPRQYSEDMDRADFIHLLEKLIFTGQTRADGPSREGRLCVMAMLPDNELANVRKQEKNNARDLMRIVAQTISLNVAPSGVAVEV
jgi:hypothetical protein